MVPLREVLGLHGDGGLSQLVFLQIGQLLNITCSVLNEQVSGWPDGLPGCLLGPVLGESL